MKTLKPRFQKVTAGCLGLGLAVLMSAPAVAFAADSSMGMMGGTMMNQNQMTEHRPVMMQVRQKARAEIQKQDDQLETLVAQMNQAAGPKKTELMARIINQLVQDRIDLHALIPGVQPTAATTPATTTAPSSR
jgi:TolA-binding protein